MDTSLPFVLLVVGLLATFLPNITHINRFAASVGAIAILLFASLGFSEGNEYGFLLLLLIPVIVGFLAGSFLPKFGRFIALASVSLVLIKYGAELNYLGFEMKFSGLVALLPFLGALMPFVSDVKGYFMEKWFGVDRIQSGNLASVMIGSLGVFFATFQAQYFGVLLFGVGWVAVSVSRERKNDVHPGFGLMALGYVFLLVKLYGLSDTSWMRGNFLMGVAAGMVGGFWNALDFTGKAKWILSTLVPVLVILLAILLGIVNENFGAFPAYVGAALGLVFYQYGIGKGKSELPLLALVLGLSPIVIWLFPARVALQSNLQASGGKQTVEIAQPKPLSGNAIEMTSQFEGTWKSELEASKIGFSLGPEGGITEGSFEEFDVVVKIDGTGKPVSVETQLASGGLTTFNDMRDESVHGSDYLHVEKFPKITYRSSDLKKEGESWFVTGDLELLGKKSPVNLEIRFIGNGMKSGKQYLTMIGRSQVDRTHHGMKSDSKIGDLVDVNFEIQLLKE